MIETKHGKCTISGQRAEIVLDTVTLFESLLESAPEILVACITTYQDELEESITNANPMILKMLLDLIESIHKENI